MNRRGLWDKNSSLGPGHSAHSQTNLLQAPRSRQRNRTASPKETISLPSVQFRWRTPRPSTPPVPPPTASKTEMLSASPRQQRDRAARSGYALPSARQSTQPTVNHYFSDTVYLDESCEGCLAEPTQLKETKQPRRNVGNTKRIRNREAMHEKSPAVREPSIQPLPLIESGSLLNDGSVTRLPLDSQCEYCGILFSRLSLAHHMKWCSRQSKQVRDRLKKQSGSAGRDINAQDKPRGNVVARVVTVGLVPGQYDQVFIHSNEEEPFTRPATRTLPYSTLHNTGHGLPLTSPEHSHCNDTEPSNYKQCKNCGKIVPTNKVGIHHRLCHSDVPMMSTGSVQIPSTHNLLKVDQPRADLPTTHAQQPSTAVCYICGRKYGSHSIRIHEPQCLKKFNAQNDKLPMNERLPLPKKRGSVARVLLREEEELLVAKVPRRRYMVGEVETKEERVQRYLESCYTEFEKELVPCKKCGRTFAPARHRKHEPNCNAKPLKLL